MALLQAATTGELLTQDGLLLAFRHSLVLSFYALVIALYMVRGPAGRTARSLPSKVVAVVATFTPLALAAFTSPARDGRLLALGYVLTTAGIAWSVWSLWHLGRNVSVIAQARQLVTSGPYRFVRHPLYFGELLAVLGVVVSGFTPVVALIWGALVTLQLHRASQEERLLATHFPDYADYRLRTVRIIPGVL